MESEIALKATMSALSRWEFAGYCALAAVTIGVAGEAVHDFTDWCKGYRWWKDNGNTASALLLIVALASEAITQFKTNNISGQIIAFVSDRSAATLERANKLETEAGLLQIDLEKERGARVAMLAQLKPRDFTIEQLDAFAAELKGKIPKLTIVTIPDAEAALYGFAIMEGLKRADIAFDWIRAPSTVLAIPGVPVSTTGVTIYEYPRGTPPGGTAHELLLKAFVQAEQFAVNTSTPLEAPPQSFPSPALFVMLKPPAFMTMPGYAMPPELKDWRPAWNPK